MSEDVARARRMVGWLVTCTAMTLIAVGAVTVAVGSHWTVWTLWAMWVPLTGVTVWTVVQVNRAD